MTVRALLRIRSISTDPARAGKCRACTDLHAQDIHSIGFKAEARKAQRHPIVAPDLNSSGRRAAWQRRNCVVAEDLSDEANLVFEFAIATRPHFRLTVTLRRGGNAAREQRARFFVAMAENNFDRNGLA